MYRTIIIDGNTKSRETLRRLLLKYCPEIELLGTCGSLKEAEELLHKFKPALVFLDITKPVSNSSALLMQLKKNNFEIIFTTTSALSLLQTTRFSDLDFLVKPIDAGDLMESVRRAVHKINRYHHREKIESLLNNIKYLNIDKKIALATLSGLEFVTLGNIIRCESDNTYTIFHMTDKNKIVVSKAIGEYEVLLMDYHFMRVHQSHLINLRYVKNYNKGNGGTITMEDNSRVEVSRRRKEQLLTRLSLI